MTVTSRLHRQKGKERQERMAPRYESGGEAQALAFGSRDTISVEGGEGVESLVAQQHWPPKIGADLYEASTSTPVRVWYRN